MNAAFAVRFIEIAGLVAVLWFAVHLLVLGVTSLVKKIRTR